MPESTGTGVSVACEFKPGQSLLASGKIAYTLACCNMQLNPSLASFIKHGLSAHVLIGLRVGLLHVYQHNEVGVL